MSLKEPDRYTELVHLFKRLRSALGAIYRDNLKDIALGEVRKGVEAAEAFAKQQTGKREQRAKKRA
jgi:hypothetical protein